VILRALGWGLLGLVATPLAVFGVMAIIYQWTSACGTPGDSGGCEMGTAVAVIASAPIGALAFFLVSLALGFSRRRPPSD
jgi:hypothetical protein